MSIITVEMIRLQPYIVQIINLVNFGTVGNSLEFSLKLKFKLCLIRKIKSPSVFIHYQHYSLILILFSDES